ncbi:AAA family ATPase [Alteromonas lipotrueiana]|uniref:AAA family ATPase n=1 Tax=Alteromonas lipotrueiana TaxID=2803815 RepID=UPI001C483BED|nr:ATP-binding protein [Alteromonas lipotrueiana]
MNYLVELSKIIGGALAGDEKAVSAYTELLSTKLEQSGDIKAADRLKELLKQKKPSKALQPSSLTRPIPVEKDNRFSLADKSEPRGNVVFMTENEQELINSFVRYINNKEKLAFAEIPINPTLLLYGPPGTGKSKLAANIAQRLDLPLVTARADALISSYLGSTSKNIRSLLEYAKEEPCVLFLDEFDAIAKARDDRNEIGELKRVVVSLLQNIDNLEDTVLVAATNHEHLLDPAIGRRFHYKIHMKNPEMGVREKLVRHLLRNFPLDENEYYLLAQVSKGMSGAEIEIIIHDYLREIIVEDKEVETTKILRRFIQAANPNISFDNENKPEEIKILRELDTEFFSGKIISQLWGISPSYVSKILKGIKHD